MSWINPDTREYSPELLNKMENWFRKIQGDGTSTIDDWQRRIDDIKDEEDYDENNITYQIMILAYSVIIDGIVQMENGNT